MPGIGEFANFPSHMGVVKTVQDCEVVCEQMTTILKSKPDVQNRIRQLMLLRDCADICALTAKYIARRSPFAKHMAGLCATVCQVCGTECSRFPDAESQHCAQVCWHCAQVCQSFAMMPM
jgi:hypothetical protein